MFRPVLKVWWPLTGEIRTGYRELRSNGEMRKLLDRKIVAQNGKCAHCNGQFTNYSDVVPDHIHPRAWTEPGETTILKTSRLSISGVTGKRDREEVDSWPCAIFI
jgi:hypothetical protein